MACTSFITCICVCNFSIARQKKSTVPPSFEKYSEAFVLLSENDGITINQKMLFLDRNLTEELKSHVAFSENIVSSIKFDPGDVDLVVIFANRNELIACDVYWAGDNPVALSIDKKNFYFAIDKHNTGKDTLPSILGIIERGIIIHENITLK